VEKVTYPGDRRDYYRIVDDLHTRVMSLRLARIEETRALLEQALDTEPALVPDIGRRLRRFSSFFDHMHESAMEAKRRWCSENDANEAAGPTGAAGER
jgi:hypothetical protein